MVLAGSRIHSRDGTSSTCASSSSLSHKQPDEQGTPFVDAPAGLVPGTYKGGLKTWEYALDLVAYLDRDVLKA